MTHLTITAGQVLRDGVLREGDLGIENGVFAPSGNTAKRFDAAGLLVLPGIVDIHGDAFERQMQPRPNVAFDPVFALAETERQLLGCGITTAFHSATLSWEPGLRGIEAWRALLAALASHTWTCDMRVHLRWEAFNLDALDEVMADIAAGRVHLVAFNDHMASIMKKLANPFEASKYAGRAGMKSEPFAVLASKVASRSAEVPAALDRLAALCRAKSLPMASHDDETIAMRQEFSGRGADICEFPVTEDVGSYARGQGDAIVMGSPNVMRGRSHLGWTSAADLAERGICTVLVSDYYYPCLLGAPFVLAGRGKLDLAQAWALVSANPAKAAKLGDRGVIADGKRADLVIVDPTTKNPIATFVAGIPAYLSAEGARRAGF
jgi:alpha-D-ribose 1-methylphosphonate 5-triphosphate diphosphatase